MPRQIKRSILVMLPLGLAFLVIGILLLSYSPVYALTIYSSDFEADDGGWTESGFSDWERGTIITGVHQVCDNVPRPEPPGAHSGVTVWATNLDGCYANSNADSILSQTFDFSNLSAPIELSWWHWYEVFETFDYAIVTVNGTQVWRTPNSTASPGWLHQTVDLSAYAGDPSVTITFLLHATTVVNRSGWYLDDISISDGSLASPEIAVLGNEQTIPSGDTTPSAADSTDFGAVNVGQVLTRTFTISNSGIADLTLTGSPAVTLTTSTHFAVTVQPTSPVISNSATTFQITFNPAVAGSFTDMVTIANSDSDENPYTFVIQGVGVGTPAITVEKTVGTDPNSCSFSDTLALPSSGQVTYCYLVTNVGSITLTRHTIVDDQLGILVSDFPSLLPPGVSAFYTTSTTISQTTFNTVEWTAFNPGPTDVVTATSIATVTVDETEIVISGNGQVIANGDSTPSAADGTDFGGIPPSQSVTRTFTISNTGAGSLDLTGTPLVEITGPAAADFSLVVSPTTPIASNNTTTFQVRFSPTITGTRAATLTIANDDSDKNPYSFAIQGVGTIASVSTNLYLPLISKSRLPDLVVKQIIATRNNVQVVIQNQGGTVPVNLANEFWVDLYVNPTPPPSGVNQTCTSGGIVCENYAVWGITQALLPQLTSGGVITLTIGDAYQAEGANPISLTPGSTIYAQVDSDNASTTYGGIQESNEGNNLSSTFSTAAINQAEVPASSGGSAALSPYLPLRSR